MDSGKESREKQTNPKSRDHSEENGYRNIDKTSDGHGVSGSKSGKGGKYNDHEYIIDGSSGKDQLWDPFFVP